DDSVALQNVFSVGKEINSWSNGGEKIHCYYPKASSSTKQLEIDIPTIDDAIRENITITGNELKIALNANGIYVNGTKVNNYLNLQVSLLLLLKKQLK
ncbi:MAG: hypothetical protein SOT71_12290, partial [Romboutsia timonensis]|uniref:hypothetical protein n=1 Tax=Romboutsia timonensis TaxID=1776391 RepID=UPI002A749039